MARRSKLQAAQSARFGIVAVKVGPLKPDFTRPVDVQVSDLRTGKRYLVQAVQSDDGRVAICRLSDERGWFEPRDCHVPLMRIAVHTAAAAARLAVRREMADRESEVGEIGMLRWYAALALEEAEERAIGSHAEEVSDLFALPRLVYAELQVLLRRGLRPAVYHEACRLNAARRIRALGIEWRLPPDNDQGADFALLRLLGFTVSVDGGLQVAPALLAPLTAKERGSSYGL